MQQTLRERFILSGRNNLYMSGEAPTWTAREIGILRANWPGKSDIQIAALLPDRSDQGVRSRRQKLGMVLRRYSKFFEINPPEQHTEVRFSCPLDTCSKKFVLRRAWRKGTPRKAARCHLRLHLEQAHGVTNSRERSVIMDRLVI